MNESAKKRSWYRSAWARILFAVAIVGAVAGLVLNRLGSLLPGYAKPEVAAYAASSNLNTLLDNPINAPFYLLVKGLEFAGIDGYLATRAAAVLIGIATVGLFWWLLTRWYSARTALFGTILFATSAWFLHTARLGTPDVLLFLLLALVAAGVWLKRTKNPFVLLLCFLLAGASMYVPGMVWFIVFVMIWEWRQIDFLFRRHLWAVALGTLLFAASITPLVWAAYRSPQILKPLAGLPAEDWPSLSQLVENALNAPLALFVRTPADPVTWLAQLPVLDAFAAAMFVLGSYMYLKHARLGRAKLFVPVLLVGWILVALGGGVTLTILVPFVYLIVATGVGFMCDSWLTIFPRNPIARFIGIGVVAIAVVTSISFQTRSYFLAWPNNPDTRSHFALKNPATSDTIPNE